MTQLFDRIGVLLPEIEVSNVTKQLKQNSVVLHIACSQDPITWNDLQFVAMLIFGQWYDYRRYSHDNFTILKCNQLTIFPRKMSFFFHRNTKTGMVCYLCSMISACILFSSTKYFLHFFPSTCIFRVDTIEIKALKHTRKSHTYIKYVVYLVVRFGNRTT